MPLSYPLMNRRVSQKSSASLEFCHYQTCYYLKKYLENNCGPLFCITDQKQHFFAAREHQGLKQINLANACPNLKQQYISLLERNKKRASDKILRRLAEGLQMSVEELKNFPTKTPAAPNTLEYWKKKAEEGEVWKVRAITAETRVSMIQSLVGRP